MRRAAKVDGNHAAIVKALRKIGAKVTDLSRVGDGVPDILVFFRGRTSLVEIKIPGGKLNERQIEWHAEHEGYMVFVVTSAEEAIAAITHPEG